MTQGTKVCLICGQRGHTSSACTGPAAKYARTRHKLPPPPPKAPVPKSDDEDLDAWYDYLVFSCLRQVAGWVGGDGVLNDGFADMRRLLEQRMPEAYWAYVHRAQRVKPECCCLIPDCETPRLVGKAFCPAHLDCWRPAK